MANTDFTGGAWTEVDGGTYLTVTSSKVAWVDFDRNNTSHHSASAAGLGISLAGDFTHKFEVQYSNLTSSPYIVFWGAFQNVKNLKASLDASEDSLVLFQYQDDFYVVIYEDGVLRDSDKSSGMTAGTTYFITVSYVASTKTVTVEIHTGAHHPAGVHVDSWPLYGTAGISVAHVQVATSYNDGTGSEADGFTQNLDLGAGGAVNETATPSALVLELVLQAITILGTGTAFIRTFDDALGITDAMGRTQVQLRTFNDGIGNVDDAGRTQVQVRIMDDGIGMLDAMSRAQALIRAIDDGIGILDAMGRATALIRALDDGVGILDATGRTQVQVRTFDDGVGSLDDAGRTQVQLRTFADTLGITDAITRLNDTTLAPSVLALVLTLPDVTLVADFIAFLRTINDDVGILDAMGRTQVQVRTFANDIGITDAMTKVGGFVRTITDSIGIVDNKGWFGVSGTNLSSYCGQEDGTSLSNALSGSARWYHSTNHTHYFILDMGVSHTWTKFRSRSNQTDDPTKVSIYVSETNGDWGAAVAVDISTWQDSAAWVEYDSTDKIGRWIKVEITETEAFPAGGTLNYGNGPIFDAYYDDGVTRLVTYVRAVADDLGITDAIGQALGFDRTVTDDIGITDAMTRGQVQARTFSDSIGITDDLARIVNYVIAQSDDVGISDAMLRVAVALRAVSDDVGITDDFISAVGGTLKAAWAFMVMRQTKN